MSWTQAEPRPSLALLDEAGLPPAARVLDVGGGTSRLVDHLLERGFRPGVLDLSRVAVERSRSRLGDRSDGVRWIEGSVLDYQAAAPWDAWHDRATFHFLTDPRDRARYRAVLESSLTPGGTVVMATFGPSCPRRCSGLPVCRYGPETLAGALGAAFHLERSFSREHRTPWGDVQEFLYARFRYRSGDV